MLQIILTLAIYIALVIPVGTYMYHIAANQRTFADPVFDRVDGVISVSYTHLLLRHCCRQQAQGSGWEALSNMLSGQRKESKKSKMRTLAAL